jgi:hypothetical protein
VKLARAVALALSLVGCVAAVSEKPPLEKPDEPRREARPFDHSRHSRKGLDCADCHGDGGEKGRAGMPAGASCRGCHGGGDPLEVAAVVSAYAALAPEARHVRPAGYADTLFDHPFHTAAGFACAECHPGATTEARASPGGPMPKATCIACHERKGGPTKGDCRLCHEVLRDAR